jgi:hypothetical protein
MKRRKLLLVVAGFILCLLVILAVVLLALAPSGSAARASVALLAVTNDAAGKKFAVLRFTNASPVGVIGPAHSVDYKTADGWLTQQPVPGVVNADLQNRATLNPKESRDVSLRFPTNGTWRFRIRFHEQPRGVKGAWARLWDLKESVVSQAKTTSYTGQSYLAETEEIKE